MRLKFWGRSAPAPAAPAALAAPPSQGPSNRRGRSFMGSALAGMFKAAANGNDKLPSIPTPPDMIITTTHMALVARSRQQWSDNDYSRAFIRLVRQNVVGPCGVQMQAKVTTPRGKLDKDTNAALEDDFEDWGRKGNCDVTGTLSWRQMQCLAVETAARDGEFIVRKVYGEAAGPHGFALQFVDPQRLPVWYNVDQLAGGGFIRHGIEFSAWGRPVAYHFTSTETNALGYYSSDGRGFVRVPAAEVIHEFIVEMVGQRRGLPWSSTSLFRLRNVNGFEDAALQNARASASKMGFIQYKEGFGPEADDDTPVTIDAEPLSFHELPEGAEIAEWQPQFPTNETAAFLKSQLRGAASGMGVPYNELANDLEGVNFSSIRQLTLDAREHYKEIQEWLIEALVAPVRDAHLAWRLLNGAVRVKGKPIPADKLGACRKVAWQPRRWTWIDPSADVKAALDSIRGGLTSASQVIREQGRDPEAVFQEIAADLEAMKAAGIPDDFIKLFMQGSIANNQKTQPKQEAPANDA
jgi:lambda family phage portal protein